MVVWEEVPCLTRRAVVLADGSPGALTEVGAPVAPRRTALRDHVQTLSLDAHAARVSSPRRALHNLPRVARNAHAISHTVATCDSAVSPVAISTPPPPPKGSSPTSSAGSPRAPPAGGPPPPPPAPPSPP